MFEGVLIPVSSADHVAMVVYAQSVFSVFGDVFPVQFVYHREFPTICTGTRTLLMSVKDSVPSTVNVYGFESCLVPWPTAHMFHLLRAWSLTLSLCWCCKQPSHMASECGQAWGQPLPSSSVSVPHVSTPPDPAPALSDPVAMSVNQVPISTSVLAPFTPTTVPTSVLESPVSTPVSKSGTIAP